MAVSASYVGRRYPRTEPYEVGREKIWEFARAIGEPHPVYRDAAAAAESGHPEVIAPPTFAIVLSMHAEEQVTLDPEFGFDFSRVIHRDQRFEYSRPVRAGDRLTVAVEVAAVASVDGNDVVTLRAEIRDARQEHVCTTTSTLVSRAVVV
ncbi:MaoC family dehydratase N-terminal domain-containing protein [Kitasatospora sp. GP82]|uniref:MaoC family dehydratase N-terminal domain-containing protein n=1 Tax=Kitasatospora sp. GP82 TaxID=3035089 RepID=UPI0024734238|nr:MaoC family dehydratase N-terminal domain-containing protein [Kitasatospora sp. GP82]MDH6125238.1 acyl dehydratase [Kitasatospora sp. GP82]